MFNSYCSIALRHIKNNPLYSAINIVGLAVGMACCILILTAVRYELSFDRYFADADRIFRVGFTFQSPVTGEQSKAAITIFPSAKQLAMDYPEVDTYARMAGTILSLRQGANQFTEHVYLADETFFSVFNFRFIEGDPDTALQRPMSVVLTQSMARKYFGNERAVGRTLSVENRHELTVTGVVEDTPANTHFMLDVVVSLNSARALLGEQMETQLNNSWTFTQMDWYGYIRLKPNASIKAIEQQLDAFYLRHVGQHAQKSPIRPSVQALRDIHLRPVNQEPALTRMGHRYVVHAAIGLALLILITACINFINLTTARFSLRMREVGMRKVLGATAELLTCQFLMETLVLVVIAAAIACALASLFMPVFGNLIFRDLTQINHWGFSALMGLLGLIVLTTFMAGLYPALILSRIPTLEALTGGAVGQNKSVMRQSLMVAQFSLSVILIVITLIANAQFQFIRSMDLGFDRERVVVLTAMKPSGGAFSTFRFFGEVQQNYMTLRAELLRHSDIVDVAGSVTPGLHSGSGTFKLRGQKNQEGVTLNTSQVDASFIDVYNMRLIGGRNFSREIKSDVLGANGGAGILTRQGARRLGFPNPTDSIGQTVLFGNRELRIVGVIDNVNAAGGYFDNKLDILINAPVVNTLSVKLKNGYTESALAHIDEVWKKIIPEYALNRYFYTASFAQFDNIFDRVVSGFTAFAVLSIVIAGFGLYAMTSFIASRRVKEIGIRKVLGASSASIIKLLLWDLSKPILFAIVIALPLAALFIDRLLQPFAAHVALHAGYYIATVLLTLCIAWMTTITQTWRAANSDPVQSLRYE